jgi:hypothetical protein
MVIVWCILLAFNGYFAVANWPSPFCAFSGALAIWSLYNLIKAAKSER